VIAGESQVTGGDIGIYPKRGIEGGEGEGGGGRDRGRVYGLEAKDG